MLKELPTWALVVFVLISLALVGWAVFQFTAAEAQLDMTEHQRWLLEIKLTVASAYLGFFFATALKFCFDEVRDSLRVGRERAALANELLAELRFVNEEFAETRADVIDFREAIEAGEIGSAGPPISKGIMYPSMPVFASAIGRLGLFDNNAAREVVTVFSGFDRICRITRVFAEHHDSSPLQVLDVLQIVMENNYARMIPQIHELDRRLSKIAGVAAAVPFPFSLNKDGGAA